jgi:tetratricopeptide (TPR) repeat protein
MWGKVCRNPLEADNVFTLFMLAALAIPLDGDRAEIGRAIPPAQVLAWQLEGVSQEEIQEEVNRRGLTECPEDSLVNTLNSAGANAETIRVMSHCKTPGRNWKQVSWLPAAADDLGEIAFHLQGKDLDSAIRAAQDQLAKQPRSADLHLILAHLLSLDEDWIRAYGEASQAVALDPRSPYAHGLRSMICYQSQLTECAVREAKFFVTLRPRDATAYIALGHAQELQHTYTEALEDFSQAEKFHPGYSAIYAGMGSVYQRTGEFEKAVQSYERAIRTEENIPEYYWQLGQVYLTEGYTRKAIEEFKKAKELVPERAEVLLALGNAYLAAEQYSRAAGEYRELLKVAPEMEQARRQCARALRAQGKIAEAEKLFVDELDPPEIGKHQ